MNSQWLSIATLLAAVVIGYSVLSNRENDSLDRAYEQPLLLGYYLKDAIITETSESGAPRVRFAASEVTQDTQDNSVTLTAVRADYLWRAADRAAKPANGHVNGQVNHWVVNADRARIPATSKQSENRIELRGNVDAHSVGVAHSTALSTQSLDIDTDQQMARTSDTVRVDIDGHTANGRGLIVDMAQNRVLLESDVTVRLAANTRTVSAVSLPDVFESDTWEYHDNVLVLTKVRSKSEPIISADQARATGADLANNQWVLSGAVRLELPQRGLVTADLATVTVRNNRVVHVQLTGAPVNFQHRRKDSDQIVNGRAAVIDYDVLTQILQFSGKAWFNNGKFEFTSDFIEYNLTTEAAHGTRGSGGPVPRKSETPIAAPKE